MTQLLRFRFRYSRKSILILLILAVTILIIYSNAMVTKTIDLGLYTTASLLTVYVPAIAIAHILHAPFSILIRTFPIAPKLFVKSSFFYAVFLLSIVFIPLFIIISYQYFKGNITAFPLCYTLGIFAFTVITTGGALKAHFKSPTSGNSFSGSDVFFYILFIFIAHILLCLGFSIIDLTYLGALITPIACYYFYYKQYKASITLYEQAEFL